MLDMLFFYTATTGVFYIAPYFHDLQYFVLGKSNNDNNK